MIVVLFLLLALFGVGGPVFNTLAALAIVRQAYKSVQGGLFKFGGGIA